jgi:HlyD family secretion protein
VKEVRFYPKTSQGVVTYEVVLEVPNPELLLRPGMTATAEIIVKELKDVLLVPNQALRFDPTRIYKKEKRGFLSLFMPAFPRRMPQIPPLEKKVWILKEGKPIPIPVKTGPSDGQFTQVVSDVLKPGMEVVIGMEEK